MVFGRDFQILPADFPDVRIEYEDVNGDASSRSRGSRSRSYCGHRGHRDVDSQPSNLYLRSMQTLPVKSERLAQLEEFARRRGKSTADALDDVLADYLEWERQDYQEAVEAVRQGLEDVKAGRTKPAEQFLDAFARKHGLPR